MLFVSCWRPRVHSAGGSGTRAHGWRGWSGAEGVKDVGTREMIKKMAQFKKITKTCGKLVQSVNITLPEAECRTKFRYIFAEFI